MQFRKPSFVEINGRKIAFDEVSPPNPKGAILLLTGLASKRQIWYKQLEVFGREYRTIAIDHRDVGDSDPVTAPYTIKDQAEDAAEVLKTLGILKAFVVGISMGGFIALELTLLHPALVGKLVLVSTSGGGLTNVPSSPKLWPTFLRRDKSEAGTAARKVYTRIMGPGYSASHPQIMDDIAEIARYRPLSAEAGGRQFRAALSHNAANRLDQIKVPTLVIHGDKDPLVPIANGRRLARKIPGAKMLTYPNVGHVPIMERADDFNQDVLAFFNS